jgi:hypothetical protein
MEKGPNLGLGGEIRYLFDESVDLDIREHFQLDAITGVLTVKRPLDREQRENFTMKIKAVDLDSIRPLSSTGQLIHK